jgi:hypothetical protein
MTSKAFKASWIIQLVVYFVFGIGGLLMIVSPTVFMADEIQIYVGQSWAVLQAANTRLFSYFLHDVRMLGFMQASAALMAILIVLYYYRRTDRVAWWLGLINTTAALAVGALLNLPIGEPGVILSMGFLTLANYVALALGAPAVFGYKRKAPHAGGNPAVAAG